MSSLPHVLATKRFICRHWREKLISRDLSDSAGHLFPYLGELQFLCNDLSELSVISSHFDSNFWMPKLVIGIGSS